VQQTTSAVDQSDYADRLLELVHRQLDEKEEEEEEKRRIIRESDEVTEVSAWLDRTEWIRHLEGWDKSKIAQLVKPAQQEEQELREVENSVVRLVEQARQTILQKKVSVFTLQRLESFQPGRDAQKPFHANFGMDTIQRYQRIWKQLLVYVLRTVDTEWQRYQCTKEQQDSIKSIRIAIDNFREDNSEAMQQEMDKYCLQLCVTLLAQRLDHDEYESAVISFLAVMGLENILGTSRYRFKSSAQYTPILSGFIKMAQMLTLQYCFQQEEDNEVESCRVLLEELHSRFLTDSSATPMDWALRLRLYGRGISRRMTMPGCINWIGDTVVYEDIELSMTDFRTLVHKLTEETQCMLHELLFVKHASELPAYSWTELKDNAAKDEPGWNFIQDKRNRFLESKRWLLRRVLQRKELRAEFMNGTGVWRQGRVKDWCDKHVQLLEKLLILIHMTGGQPARARELLSIRYCNTEKGGHRSIFIENGLMVIVTYYHKGYNITGTEKIIHRYLPEEVGDILLQYIWLVLPLRQQFDKMVFKKEGIKSSFLWTSDWGNKKWDGDRMREVLKRESDRLIGIRMHKQAYRHIAIAISDRYMKRKFNRDDEKREKDEDEQQDDALARQSTHSPETAGSVYARSLQEAPSHVQTMRYRYRTASTEWHAVLEFNERMQSKEAVIGMPVRGRLGGDVGELLGVKRGRMEEHEKSPGPRIRRWQSLRQTDLQASLEGLLGKEKQFRGKQQAALRAIMDGKSPVIVVMRTGGGKSLMFMLPASVKDAGTTVVVTPLIALKQDMRRRCRELGLECQEWDARRKIHDSCILLVTPEAAVSQGFMNYLRKLQVMDRLDRIVIDECHILLNTRLDFRRKLQKLRKVVEFAVQLVLLTATLPVSKESELLSMISIEGPVMFREQTTRHNIAYSIRRCNAEDIDDMVKNIVEGQVDGRIIVYGGRVDRCKELAELLSCAAYIAESGEKTEALQEWIENKSRVIVGTNALGLGIDVDDVRLVLHAEVGFDLVNYGQESGRAGRDGKRSEAIILVAEDRILSKHRDTEQRLMWEYALTEGCRRIKLDQYMDGNMDTVECVEGQEACDNCVRGRELMNEVEWTQETRYGVSQGTMYEEVDEAGMITAADMAKYEEQERQRKEQQLGYRRK
jgi:superfamily II DNA helicase RecQ